MTVPTSTNGESKVSRAAIGAVVATVVVLLIGTLCVIGTTTVLLCKRWRAKHLKKNVANHTDASYSIGGFIYSKQLKKVPPYLFIEMFCDDFPQKMLLMTHH